MARSVNSQLCPQQLCHFSPHQYQLLQLRSALVGQLCAWTVRTQQTIDHLEDAERRHNCLRPLGRMQ